MKNLKFYLGNGQIVKDKTVVPLAKRYLDKARNSLVTMRILTELKDKKIKEKLNVSEEYDPDEWVAVIGYYAMYSAALALLAKTGFKSKNHAATIIFLEDYFVKKKILDNSTLLSLKDALLQKEEVEKLSDARQKREIAQYSVTKKTTKEISEKIEKDAYDFVNKCEEILKNPFTS